MPTRLRCEYHEHPLGLDERAPRLSWELEGGGSGGRQTAYQVQVEEVLPRSGGGEERVRKLWDSGRVEGGRTFGVVYRGEPLETHGRCRWRVRVWDERREESGWSRWAGWAMGVWEAAHWAACWVSSPVGHCPNSPLFRGSFLLPTREVVDARLYATAKGICVVSLNGRAVNDELFSPGWTDYRQKIHYRCYDVLGLLREGENVLGVVLNGGWYSGELGLTWMSGHYGRTAAALLMLRVVTADGAIHTFGTDRTWKTSTSGVLESGFFGGEVRDATLDRPGWDKPGYDDAGWWDVEVEAVGDRPRLAWHPGPPVRAWGELAAVERWRVRPGSWVYDFGQNFGGRVKLMLPDATPAGTTLRLRHGEMVNPDRTLYVENLRRATSMDTFTVGESNKGDSGGADMSSEGGGTGSCVEPVFTFHGFRYAEMTGWPEAVLGEPPVNALKGVVLTSDVPDAGSFECSHPMVNQLHRNILWTQRANFIDVPTDCPQRDERMGWTGDAQAFIKTALYQSDAAAFFTKWIADLNEAQHANGRFPNVAPDLPRGLANPLFAYGDAAWGDAGIICPMAMYDAYGDTRLLERCYPHMQRWLAWQRGDAEGGLRRYDSARHQVYGDWLNIDAPTDFSLIMSAFYAYDAALMRRAALAVGRADEAAEYHEQNENIAAAFVSQYLRPDGGIGPAGGEGTTQTACLLALHFDLLPEDRREATLVRLVEDLERHGWMLTTGFVGLPYLLPVLSRFGRSDVAYRLLLNTGFPSWGYSIEQGATTIWERWNGWLRGVGPADPSMNSFSHYAYGSVGEWLFSDVGGLFPLEPGYGRVRIRPRVCAAVGFSELAITWCKLNYHSIRGPIRVAWRVEGERFYIEVDVPPNVEAELWMPTGGAGAIRGESGGSAASGTPVVLTLGPGRHRRDCLLGF